MILPVSVETSRKGIRILDLLIIPGSVIAKGKRTRRARPGAAPEGMKGVDDRLVLLAKPRITAAPLILRQVPGRTGNSRCFGA